jgi:hypothetical protein
VAIRGLVLPALEALLAARFRDIFVALMGCLELEVLSFLNFCKSEGPNLPILKPSAPATTTQTVGAISDNRLTKITILGVIGSALV